MSPVPYPRIAGAFIALSLITAPTAATPQSTRGQPVTWPAPPPYADIADMVVKAPMVIDATVHTTNRIKGAEAAGVPAGFVRYYLTVDVTALIRAPAALPARVGYVYDAPLEFGGKAPKFKKARVLLFARPVAGAGDQIQLVTPRAQIAWSPAAEAIVRNIAKAVADPASPPAITGISNAFHAAGVLPGEGETQIFLKTTGHPISLGVQRKQNQAPVWTVSLTEVVEDALPPPPRDSFLWYRLACGLPAEISDATLAGLEPTDAAAVREDYALIRTQLGPCRPGGG